MNVDHQLESLVIHCMSHLVVCESGIVDDLEGEGRDHQESAIQIKQRMREPGDSYSFTF